MSAVRNMDEISHLNGRALSVIHVTFSHNQIASRAFLGISRESCGMMSLLLGTLLEALLKQTKKSNKEKRI